MNESAALFRAIGIVFITLVAIAKIKVDFANYPHVNWGEYITMITSACVIAIIIKWQRKRKPDPESNSGNS